MQMMSNVVIDRYQMRVHIKLDLDQIQDGGHTTILEGMPTGTAHTVH